VENQLFVIGVVTQQARNEGVEGHRCEIGFAIPVKVLTHLELLLDGNR